MKFRVWLFCAFALPFALKTPAFAQSDSIPPSGKLVGGIFIPYRASKCDVISLIDAISVYPNDTSDATWAIYSRDSAGSFMGTIEFDNTGLVSEIYAIENGDTAYAKRNDMLYKGSLFVRLIVNSTTKKHKDLKFFKDHDVGIATAGLNATIHKRKAYYSYSLYVSLFSLKTAPGVKYDSTLGTGGEMTELATCFSAGHIFKVPKGYTIPYSGLGLSLYSIPVGKEEEDIRTITGTRTLALGMLTFGVRNTFFNNRMSLDYNYTNTFPLQHGVTVSGYFAKGIVALKPQDYSCFLPAGGTESYPFSVPVSRSDDCIAKHIPPSRTASVRV